MKRILLCALLLAVAASAHASPIKDNPYRDPKAPCYRWPATDYDGDGVFDRIDKCPNTPKGCIVDVYGCETDADHDGVCDGIDKCPDTPAGLKVDAFGCADIQKTAMPTKEPEAPKVVSPPPPAPAPPPSPPVSEMERKLVETGTIRLENVYFETNSAKLLPESETTLNEAGAILEKFADLRIEVQGHTDTRGSGPYDMKLSQARAEAVRQYLLDHFHLDPDHYVARGYGKTQPETKERNQEELLRNRRVVLKVLNPDVLPKGVEIQHQ